MTTRTRKPRRIALALAGGGPLGAIHEIGALCALDEALGGIELSGLQHYVGVSTGGCHRDPELYLANTFGDGQRRQLAEHAYQQTRAMLRARRASLAPKLARHGIAIDADVLADRRRHLVTPKKAPTRIGRAVAALEAALEDLGHALQAT